MKKILSVLFISLFMLMICPQAQAVEEFLTGEPAGTRNLSTIDDYVEDNNIALLRGLAHNQHGALIIYASASTVTVQAGEVFCSNSAASITLTRANTSATTVTIPDDLDAGSETNSTRYYVYAVGAGGSATFTCKISISSTTPTGATYYKRLGSFYNNASGNIEGITNDNIVGTVPSGVIVMWHGLIANIPSGWVLCNGSNSTPDLREKFVRGAAASTEAGGTGGADANAGLAYSGTTSTPSATMNTGGGEGTSYAADDACTHTYSGTTSAGAAESNLPPYYEILYIMKQ